MKFQVEIELFGRGSVKGDEPVECGHGCDEDGRTTCDCPEVTGKREPIEDAVVQAIAHHIMDRREYQLNEHFDKAINRRVNERVNELIDAEAAPRIRMLLDEGWTPTNRYGDREKRVTFTEMVIKTITEQQGDGYSRKPSLIERVAQEKVGEALNGELGKVIKEASEKFRATVDDIAKAKLGETLKNALGLR